MKSFLVIIFCLQIGLCLGQGIGNEFFTLHNIIRGDSIYDTFDKQVALIKQAGFDGVEINQTESFEGMKAALDKHQFKGSYFYVKLNLEEPYMDPRLPEYIKALKGSGTIIAPFIVSESKRYKSSDGQADTLIVRLVRQLADLAAASRLEVAIYPHYGFYVEKTAHALALVKQIDRKNAGLTFNLCHWLATTTADDRKSLHVDLKAMKPYLKMITISGANAVITDKKNVWDDYILPLGQGTFDTYGLVKYIVKDLGFKGPIGVQCYNIKGNKPLLISSTMEVWKRYKANLTGGK
ncbi:sugar phosphate isomerase/epimerase family protein [Dyadobacter psychrophilus]|uniref:Sugar phosphate isomerase/epimerase n=1 Tax=Dyadobacter psychrophilus TaxID=651661 RepID=A0A1T5EFM3_9BACT|nr:TIM barrel protein [Dyadobacter psychrophilus]SKB82701.1 Sugar phosphate isomerase/epimerase [Dyadobacter psychrophilus]